MLISPRLPRDEAAKRLSPVPATGAGPPSRSTRFQELLLEVANRELAVLSGQPQTQNPEGQTRRLPAVASAKAGQSDESQSFDHLSERPAGVGDRPAARGQDDEMLATPAAPLWRRIADARAYEALYFQAIKGDVHGANRQNPVPYAPQSRA